MFRKRYLWRYFELARISKVKWMILIHTRRGLGVWMRTGDYLWLGMDELEHRM